MELYANEKKTKASLTNEKWRTSLTKGIQDGSIKIKICELNTAFLANSTKVLTSDEKGSASNSIILFGALKVPLTNVNNEVVGKIFFTSLNPREDNSLAVEAYVYEKVAWPLIQMHVTPHLILYIGYATCDLSHNPSSGGPGLIGELMEEARRSIMSRGESKYNFDEMHVLLSERSKGKVLYDYIRSGSLSWTEWQPILFQLIYTIQCFIEFGFMHNDLHTGNIFVDEIPETTFYYFIFFPFSAGGAGGELKLFKMRTKYFLRIYDFDFATSAAKNPVNTKLRSLSWLCQAKGICQDVNWYTDLYRSISSIARNIKLRPMEEWLANFIDSKTLADMNLAKSGVLCEESGPSSCKKIIPNDSQLKHPIDILEDGFSKFIMPKNEISASFVNKNSSKIYATPSSRKIFPPKNKKDYEIRLDMLK